MLVIENETTFSPPKELFLHIMEILDAENIELLIVNEAIMKKLNLEHRGVDESTDVLSFPLEPFPHSPLGSIVLNIDAINYAATKFGHSNKDEACLLFIHGLLHLLGFDHELDSGEMRGKEAFLVEALNLPSSLIIRAESYSKCY
ncbi:MAG: rRNA maturation RNase YbeY [Campylobacteraceae bacterium]|nr:rRNA maturation RNase YbeY [Campylobacteraceae bacterium]